MRWPRRRRRLFAEPVLHVRRYRVSIVLNAMDTGEVLMQPWVPPIIDYMELGPDSNALSVMIIPVSATSSDRAAAYVRRQLGRGGITPVRVEAR